MFHRSIVMTCFAATTFSAAAAPQNQVLRLPSIPSALQIPHNAVQNSPITGQAMTVEFWIYYESGPARVVSKRNCSFGGFTVHCDPHPDGGQFHMEFGSGVVQLDWFCGVIPRHEWHHVAFSWDHAQRRMDYIVDGSLVNSTATEATDLPVASSNSLRFAEQCQVGFVGAMDNVRYWSTARTASQVKADMHSQYTPAEASGRPGLVGSWTFDGASPLQDGSGLNSAGTLTGQAVIVAEELPYERNHVLVLDSLGEHVLVPHSPSLAASDAITVEYWVNFRNTTGFGRIGKSAPSDCQWEVVLYAAPNQSAFNLHGPPADVSQWDAPRNRWAHIAATWSKASGTSRVYIDGTLIKETAGASTDMLDRDFPLYIGHLPGFSNTQLYGMVDNLRIWNIERSQADIQSSMHVQYSTSDAAALPALMASYSFEDGATDATGRNNGQFVGGAGIKIDDSPIPTSAREWQVSQGGNGHWYAIDRTPTTSSFEAKRGIAINRGGEIACITDASENSFVSATLESSGVSGAGRLVLGGRKCAGCDWSWIDGTPWTFTAWRSGEPNNGGETRVEMFAGGIGDWADVAESDGSESRFAIEWSADCNGDGIVDFTQIRNGSLLDANGDNIPDCCVASQPCSPCPPDVNRDGYVDGADLAALLAGWGVSGSTPADVNGDDFVNGADLGLVLASWGERCTD